LNKKGIITTIVPDSSVAAIMSKINKVIIGTRAIMANGGLISYNGVYNVCLAASKFNIPVIVVGGTFKLTPMYPFTHETFNELLSPDKVFKLKNDENISNIKFYVPAYDYVPPQLITTYVTNNGNQNPSYIYRLFNELYSQEDYFL
jgi:translation initiation factor eIF-2B subunit beta